MTVQSNQRNACIHLVHKKKSYSIAHRSKSGNSCIQLFQVYKYSIQKKHDAYNPENSLYNHPELAWFIFSDIQMWPTVSKFIL